MAGRLHDDMDMLPLDPSVLYFFFFIFFSLNMANIFSNLPDTNWLDPDTLEQQFRDSYAARNLATDWSSPESVVGSVLNASTVNLTSTTPVTITTAAMAAPPATTTTSTMAANTTTTGPAPAAAPSSPQWVIDEVSLRPYPFVRWASILSPLPVFATWVICGWDTWTHAQVIWRRESGSTEAHDLAIQIIALPMVYSLLSLSALVRMWKVMSNFFGEPSEEPWALRRDRAMEIYEAAYQVADLYEAWALHHFAVLAMQVLRKCFQTSGGQLVDRPDTSAPVYQAWAGTLKGLHKSVRSLTMQGIWSFVIVCAVQSMYGLTAPLLEEAFEASFPKIVEAMAQNKDKVRFFFLGMGTVASTAAICNILQIERTFHLELLHFKPFWKFWGTKVLVSIAFLQSLLFMLPIPPFRGMSTVQANLTYSTLMCYECLLLSLIHMYAWSAQERWYQEHGGDESKGLTALESLDLQLHATAEIPPEATQYGLRRAADGEEVSH